jgi:hypothetical protein
MSLERELAHPGVVTLSLNVLLLSAGAAAGSA